MVPRIKGEPPFEEDAIKAIMQRKNYIELAVKNNKAKEICKVKVKVTVFLYRYIWGQNQFLVKPETGDNKIWKHWKHLISYNNDNELVS